MNKYTALIISILIAAYTNVYAQLNPVWNVQSPEVANLGTYGQIPVSHFTGVPNISIPVYNIKVGKYSFPISISYHLASVKPQNQGGCLGLGWNLMAGGYITRTIRGGIYDEQCDANGKAHGYYAFAKRLKNIDEKELEKENDSLFLNNDYKRNFHEISADEFSFSFFGYSGRQLSGKIHKLENGLQYGIYYREFENGKYDYVLAFAGTNDFKDIQQDINQATGTFGVPA